MKVTKREFGKTQSNPMISVVVVAYRTGAELQDCLDSLSQQLYKNFEVLVVDNASENVDMLKQYPIRYYKLDKNYGPSYARNYGAKQARGKLLAFLDDDAITDKNWTQSIFNAFQNRSIASIRGRILPKSNNIYTYTSRIYDLGDAVLDSLLTLEGNSAIRRKVFLEVGGFDPKLFGHEGIELSYRLASHGKQLYIPDVIIHHDSADTLGHYLERELRQAYNASLFSYKYPEIITYAEKFTYPSLTNKKNQLNVGQRLQVAILKVLSVCAYITGSLLFKINVIFFRKKPTTHTKF